MMCQSSPHIGLQIGLAVGDIEAVQKNARLKRLAMQVQLHTEIERKLPQRILEWVDKKEWKEYVGGRRGAISKVTNQSFYHSTSSKCEVLSHVMSAFALNIKNGVYGNK